MQFLRIYRRKKIQILLYVKHLWFHIDPDCFKLNLKKFSKTNKNVSLTSWTVLKLHWRSRTCFIRQNLQPLSDCNFINKFRRMQLYWTGLLNSIVVSSVHSFCVCFFPAFSYSCIFQLINSCTDIGDCLNIAVKWLDDSSSSCITSISHSTVSVFHVNS